LSFSALLSISVEIIACIVLKSSRTCFYFDERKNPHLVESFPSTKTLNKNIIVGVLSAQYFIDYPESRYFYLFSQSGRHL
jgi:hypothetical protein